MIYKSWLRAAPTVPGAAFHLQVQVAAPLHRLGLWESLATVAKFGNGRCLRLAVPSCLFSSVELIRNGQKDWEL
jgi:hypothetical protein